MLIKNVRIIDPRAAIDIVDDVLISPQGINIAPSGAADRYDYVDGTSCLLVPGFVDLHVHFREPGFSYKEDIASGIYASLAGGVTSALVMPNTSPVIDAPKHVDYQLKRARRSGFDLMVAGAASFGLLGEEATDIAALKLSGVKAITDDGRPILSDVAMEKVLRDCRRHDLVCMQHAEDTCQSCGHSLNDGAMSRRLALDGQHARAEYELVARDIQLAEKIGARYHVLHVSSAESIALIRKAKRRGALVSCEVSPHHLLLSDRDIGNYDGNKKMNPPLRSKADNEGLIEAINDGTIDAVASDHAPHHRREKLLPFVKVPFGVVGVETSMLALLSLVKKRAISLNSAIKLMTSGPARVLKESARIGTMVGAHAYKNAVLIDPRPSFMLTESMIKSRSKNSAFLGRELHGKILMTFLNGQLLYRARGN